MEHVPAITYILDAIGVFGVVVGGYVAARSTYSRENSKDAALLIDTQRKRIDSLLEELQILKKDRDSLHAQMNEVQGQLNAYKELQLIKPGTLDKLMTAQTEILAALKKGNKL
jgi:Tfp pilus assembly protein PilN